jgi:hypothetical protein
MSDGMILSKSNILSAKDSETIVKEVPEWGGNVRMRPLSGKGRDEFEARVSENTVGAVVDVRGLKALLLSLVLVDEEGELVFSKEDIDALNEKSSTVLTRLFEEASKLNGIGEEKVKDAEKNSDSDQNEKSGSSSQDK